MQENSREEETLNQSASNELLSVKRHNVSFYDCLMTCAASKELVTEFDRLTGNNLSLRGAPIELMVDQATGRFDKGLGEFIDFCWDAVFTRF